MRSLATLVGCRMRVGTLGGLCGCRGIVRDTYDRNLHGTRTGCQRKLCLSRIDWQTISLLSGWETLWNVAFALYAAYNSGLDVDGFLEEYPAWRRPKNLEFLLRLSARSAAINMGNYYWSDPNSLDPNSLTSNPT